MEKKGGMLLTVVGLALIIGSLFLYWDLSYSGVQWLFLDDLGIYFSILGDLMVACEGSGLCGMFVYSTIMLLIGGVLCVIGIFSPIVGVVGAIVTILVPGINFFANLIGGSVGEVGIGLYICFAGCIIHAKAKYNSPYAGMNAYRPRTRGPII